MVQVQPHRAGRGGGDLPAGGQQRFGGAVVADRILAHLQQYRPAGRRGPLDHRLGMLEG